MLRWVIVVAAACDSGRPKPPPAPPPEAYTPHITIDAAVPVLDAPELEDTHQRLANEATIRTLSVKGERDRAIPFAIAIAANGTYQINLDLKPHLEVAPPAGITATPFEIARWDAHELQMTTTITGHETGTYELHGTWHFAVCQRDRCFPKAEPITIAVEIR